METTALYVEYIVIGMETLVWILMIVFVIIGDAFTAIISYCIENILPSAMVIIVCYILGLVTDRIVDTMFEKRKKEIKKGYTLESQTSIAIWEEYSNSTYANFTLSRIRILRSTIFNSAIIGMVGTYLSYEYYNNALAIFTALLFTCIFWGANSAHNNLLDNYYSKTSALENESNKKEKSIRKVRKNDFNLRLKISLLLPEF